MSPSASLNLYHINQVINLIISRPSRFKRKGTKDWTSSSSLWWERAYREERRWGGKVLFYDFLLTDGVSLSWHWSSWEVVESLLGFRWHCLAGSLMYFPGFYLLEETHYGGRRWSNVNVYNYLILPCQSCQSYHCAISQSGDVECGDVERTAC